MCVFLKFLCLFLVFACQRFVSCGVCLCGVSGLVCLEGFSLFVKGFGACEGFV